MYFQKTTREQAEELARHVMALEPVRLRELAVWMHTTGGPLDEMDGSVASLVALWRWFVAFVDQGCPGVGDDEVPAFWPTPCGFRQDAPERRAAVAGTRRAQVAAEGLSFYVRLVLERQTGRAQWHVFEERPNQPDRRQHAPILLLGDGGEEEGMLWTWGRGAYKGTSPLREEGRLFARFAGPGSDPRQSDPGASSLLRPYLDLEPATAPASPVTRWSSDWWPVNSPARQEPEPVATPIAEQGPAGEDMTLARGPGEGLERPELLAPLDATLAARALTEAGFVGTDDGPVTVIDVTTDANELAHPAEAAVVQVLAHDATLRALHLGAVQADAATWAGIVGPLQAFAARAGARFLPDHAFE